MFILFGTNIKYTEPLHVQYLQHTCPKCGSTMKSQGVKTWFTLFFIPIFPIKTHNPVYKCENCGATVFM